MVLIDVHKKNIREKRRACKQLRQLQQLEKVMVFPATDDPSSSDAIVGSILAERQNSFTDQDDMMPPVSLLSHQRSFLYDDLLDLNNPELSIYSEEGIADMDLPDAILFEEFDYLDNITSCNKVENCLMLMGRKWSLLRQPTLQTIHSESEEPSNVARAENVLFNLGVVQEQRQKEEDLQ